MGDHSGFCSLLALSTWDYVHTGHFCNWDHVHFSTLSTRFFDDLDSVHLEVCPHDILPQRIVSTIVSVNSWILPTLGSVFLEVGPTGCLTTMKPSTWESGYITFFPRKTLFSIGSVNSGLHSLLVQSTWEFVHLRLNLTLILSTRNSVHLTNF